MNTISIGVGMFLLTVGVFFAAKKFAVKYKNPILNPTLTTTIIIIIILVSLNIPYETYMDGGKWLHELLGPTVVALAFPLYKYKELLLKYFQPVLVSIFLAVTLNLITVYIILNLLGYTKEMIFTALPKSITTAVAVQIAGQIGGIPSLTAVFVMIAGFTGAIIGPYLLKIFKFDHTIARGMAFGNASHAIGTAKAFEDNLETGSISSAGMILSAIFSSFLIPFLVWILF
ncbi:LrgB family protein [Caldibacillus sp. 210928-DFI.2.22]|uniref:LrgB family protein n=1 Tax=Bacillaceae TaxID=186817 RepID=UPI001D06EA9D|nr:MULTISPECIES: LrgB family protein [unclassified Caldibacillus]MCB7071550.1 LrgB family protein [Caldibacillus sp. 210928-DFI.2.22]MCB7074983.1 LrgB family protein [Caldibacillus sp. 210928-DFI.2.18]